MSEKDKDQVTSAVDEEAKNGFTISRRNFLKAVGIGTAAVATVAVASPLAASGIRDGGLPGVGVKTNPTSIPRTWDIETDILILGGGAVGLPASIRAKDTTPGLDVMILDANYDCGGHAIISGGNVPLGGGTSWQKRDGLADTPDILYRDLTDWSVVNAQGAGIYRYNDRNIHRTMADNMAPCFEFLLANGVRFANRPIDNSGAQGTGVSFLREAHTVWTDGPSMESPAGNGGTNLCRDMERSARKKGVKFLFNYHMDTIFREDLVAGRVVGVQASYTPTDDGKGGTMPSFMSDGNLSFNKPTINVRARKAIIVATGGSSGNHNFRRISDPRLTEEIPGSCHEYSLQDASGELAVIAIGGTLWGTATQSLERSSQLLASNTVGVRTNYVNCVWTNESPIAHKIKYFGVVMRDWQNAIMVNQEGKRFYSETAGFQYAAAGAGGMLDNYGGYVQYDWRNGTKIPYNPINYINAALAPNAGTVAPDFAAGPQWAIFDQDAVTRQRFDVTSPDVMDPQYFFKADTLEELASRINTCPYQKYRMDGAVLKATVDRYNTFVGGNDVDFDKPSPKYAIEKAPFYAAWNTVQQHDTYMGVRVNGNCQVLTLDGKWIPGLYAGGECTGGASAHGLARCLTQGYIVGAEAARS
ncbi:MAG: FAD-binding protein [Treponema sp.]|nr:FAD-binding protein [Treponema sp.]